MNYYSINDEFCISSLSLEGFISASEADVTSSKKVIYFLTSHTDSNSFRRSYSVTHPDLLEIKKEDLDLLRIPKETVSGVPEWLLDKINQRKVCAVNINHLKWKDVLKSPKNSGFRINIAGMGDVGGILASGLRLLGGSTIDTLGLYDLKKENLLRWYYELSQINYPSLPELPEIKMLEDKDIFNCDMFVFCITAGVPPLTDKTADVRIVQLEKNKKIMEHYAYEARIRGFNGIFAVVSDPVDQLCRACFDYSNTDKKGNLDLLGIPAENIRGFGLGVMNARASFMADEMGISCYKTDGRAYGPHGNGLIIADSIKNYNHELSLELTEKTQNANIRVRETGFKPYIAPALSSGAISLLSVLKGDWNYSSTFIGGVFMGAKNRLLPSGTELERLDIPDKLFLRLQDTYSFLGKTL